MTLEVPSINNYMNLMPVSISDLANDRDQQRECEVLVALENGEEIVVFEETHSSVGHLQVRPCNALDEPFEELRDEGLQLGNLTDLKHLQELVEEHDFLS